MKARRVKKKPTHPHILLLNGILFAALRIVFKTIEGIQFIITIS